MTTTMIIIIIINVPVVSFDNEACCLSRLDVCHHILEVLKAVG